MGGAHESHVSRGREAELHNFGNELPSCDFYRDDLFGRICHREATLKLHGRFSGSLVEVLDFLHLGDSLFKSASEGDEQLVNGVELELDNVSADPTFLSRLC